MDNSLFQKFSKEQLKHVKQIMDSMEIIDKYVANKLNMSYIEFKRKIEKEWNIYSGKNIMKVGAADYYIDKIAFGQNAIE